MTNSFMKTGKFLCIVVLMWLAAPVVYAQQWTFGPKVDLGLSVRSSINAIQVADVQVTTGVNTGDVIGLGIGGFARYDRPRWYGQAELFWQRRSALAYSIGTYSSFLSQRNIAPIIGSRLVGGYKPLPWLRLTAGVAASRIENLADIYQSTIDSYYRQAEEYPQNRESYLKSARSVEVEQAISQAIKPITLDLVTGIGVDIGGLTVDLTHRNSLTPIIDGFIYQNQAYPLQQRINSWSLQLGYRLFPVKAHLLAPRRSNRAYERIKKDIPFHRNEIHVAGGLLGEDIGSAFLYENRYTRYLTRRFGLSVGANLMRRSTGFLPKEYTQVQALPGIRFLPLYSRRHTIGLTAGPLLSYQTGFEVISGGKNADGSIAVVNLRTGSQLDRFSVGAHATVDYQFALSDRLLIGPWLRFATKSAYAGIQAGYRF